ncbi:TetR/AcrR family transcriptional regulator [Sphingobacterium corticibacter]|uniref:TetR/AcrR family transcriptional regulator n=1 Tax=Sphingobacterium corticibacter TaxID=2171749 RepID=A0A2T8HEU7_9SPHI|nr:TetR/AcrR family transcriptional regulator [Sphingobacterium corticibacter]PVH23882.1 TetR/AcrR family transcriptional regulator [Sphingobacterium corticibacter]
MTMKSADAKRVKIIESALRRFSHFGMAKTTMAEIAKDLAFSKALLYYYFPDKNNLYAAVWNHLLDELLDRGDVIIARGGKVAEVTNLLLEERMHFLNDYYNVFADAYSFRFDIPSDLQDLIPKIFEKELQQFVRLLQIGVANGEIEMDDVEDTARIFLVSILGMRLGLLKDFNAIFTPPTKEEVLQMLNMQKRLAAIFLNGLKKC